MSSGRAEALELRGPAPLGPGNSYAGWMLLVASLAVYVAVSVFVTHQPFHVGVRRLRYFDLKVYRGAADVVLHGRSLYDTRILDGFHFTYPPFAALLFTPLVALPLGVDKLAVTAVNIGALIGALWLALRIRQASGNRRISLPLHNPRTWSVVALAAAAALWLEPVVGTLGYGQIDLVIALLIVFDLSRSDTTRSKGALIGLAAGIKLTPLLFVPYLLLTGRRRAAAIAMSVFAATVALGFVLLAPDASRYWGGVFLDSSRVGRVYDPTNQSLRGVATRLASSSHVSTGWLIAIALVAVTGFAAAVIASRRGDEATGFSLCALTALLASPISWTHHWALAVPALFLLVVSAYERRSWPRLIAACLIVIVGYAYLPERLSQRDWLHLNFGQQLIGNAYVWIALVAIAIGCIALSRGNELHPRSRH